MFTPIEITRPVARKDHLCEVCGPGIKKAINTPVPLQLMVGILASSNAA